MLKVFYFTPNYIRRICLMVNLVLATTITIVKAQQNSTSNGKSTFTAKLMNMEAASNETFRYNTSLHNGTGKTNVYELKADLPLGWLITYRVDGSSVTSISLDPGKTQDIGIEITPTSTSSPQKYKIPLRSVAPADTLTLTLEAVVKGSYNLALSTPSGRLSEEVTAGSQQQIQLLVKNIGTLPLTDINLSSQLPNSWEMTFDPTSVKELLPGKEVTIKATLKVPDKTIAGDYAATLNASSNHSNAQAAFRFIVKTSLLSGWIGILVILIAIGIVLALVRKYGRR